MSERTRSLLTRWLGAGLAVVVSVVTLGLAVTGRLTLYISPESAWFAAAGAVVTIAFAVWSCTLPLGAELDHDHDHAPAHGGADEHDGEMTRSPARRMLGTAAVVSGGVLASGVVVASLLLPPASLSAELAMAKAEAQTVLFAGADDVVLGVADTSAFGVGDWASVFATATRPENYDGSTVTLTGFVTPTDDPDRPGLTRLVITHCVIDAQPATLPVGAEAWAEGLETGQWVEITGTVRVGDDGALRVDPTDVVAIDEPGDPYEY